MSFCLISALEIGRMNTTCPVCKYGLDHDIGGSCNFGVDVYTAVTNVAIWGSSGDAIREMNSQGKGNVRGKPAADTFGKAALAAL